MDVSDLKAKLVRVFDEWRTRGISMTHQLRRHGALVTSSRAQSSGSLSHMFPFIDISRGV